MPFRLSIFHTRCCDFSDVRIFLAIGRELLDHTVVFETATTIKKKRQWFTVLFTSLSPRTSVIAL
jgi:hypothetical protein